MTRYQTKLYVTVSLEEAQRHAKLDQTPEDQIRVTPDVTLLHKKGSSWALWSDGKMTRGYGLPKDVPSAQSLSPDAEGIIDAAQGSDDGQVEGGWETVTRVQKILATTVLRDEGTRGYYANPKIEKLRVLLVDGTQTDLYVYTKGYFEGYHYKVFLSMDSLQADIQPVD